MMKASIVAIFGWIMPEPLAMPVIVTSRPEMVALAERILWCVSVVMMARAAASRSPSGRASASSCGPLPTSPTRFFTASPNAWTS